MNKFEFLNKIYLRNITLQQVVALVIKTFALNHKLLGQENANESTETPLPQKASMSSTAEVESSRNANANIAFAEVLSKLSEKDKSFIKSLKHKMSHAKLFAKGEILKEIDVVGLDSTFLLNLMLHTNFLDITTASEEACRRNHLNTCCSDCNHYKRIGACITCNKTKSECQEVFQIFCDECKLCTTCCKKEYFFFYNNAMATSAQKPHQECVMYCLKDVLIKDALNFRNLFHATLTDCEKFLNNEPGATFAKFPKLKSAEELLRYGEILMNSMISLVKICFKNKRQPIGIEELLSRLQSKNFETSIFEVKEIVQDVTNKFDFNENQINELKKQLDEMEQWKDKTDKRLDATEQWRISTEKRLDKTDLSFDETEKRLDETDKRLDKVILLLEEENRIENEAVNEERKGQLFVDIWGAEILKSNVHILKGKRHTKTYRPTPSAFFIVEHYFSSFE